MGLEERVRAGGGQARGCWRVDQNWEGRGGGGRGDGGDGGMAGITIMWLASSGDTFCNRSCPCRRFTSLSLSFLLLISDEVIARIELRNTPAFVQLWGPSHDLDHIIILDG